MRTDHYRLTLTVEGPVFIGSGDEIKKFEYVYDRQSDTVYVIDTLKLFGALQKRSGLQEKFEQHINQNRNLTEFFRDNGLQQQVMRLAKYSYKAGGDPRNNNIKAFVKNTYGQPYIPGSSLKGAVRTAILYGIIKDNYDETQCIQARNKISSGAQSRSPLKYYKKEMSAITEDFERKMLHTLMLDKENPESAVNSIMRGLRISDSEPLSLDCLCVCSKEDIKRDGAQKKSPRSLPMLRECLRPGTIISFDMDIDDRYFKFGTDFLDRCFKIYYNKQWEQMIKFTLQSNSPKPSSEESYIVIGGGSGYISKTFTHMIMGKRVDDERVLRTVSAILSKQFDNPKRNHKHYLDIKTGVSPHTRKMTTYKREYVDFGICNIKIDKL